MVDKKKYPSVWLPNPEGPTVTKNSKWRSEAVYDGPPLKSIPDSMPYGTVYRVEGHPYWVVDYYDGNDRLIKGVSTGTTDSDTAIDHKRMLEGEPSNKDKVKEGKHKNYHISQRSPFSEMRMKAYESASRAKRGLPRLPGFLGLLTAGALAPWEEIIADPVTEVPSYLLEAGTGLKPQKAVQDTGRISPWRVGATIAQDTAGDIAEILRTDDIPQEPYYGMGRQRGLLDGHPGIGRERQKRRTNIWT